MADEKFSNFLTDIIDADLAEGKVDVVHTRFPPEPNGYLHIGSAKAIFINYTIAKHYGGLFNLRFDDTNPAREGDEYVQSILQDLKWLGAEPNGGIFYGSDYFERCYEYAEQLIKEGKAYVDDLTREEMQEYRGNDAGKPSRPSPYRDRTPEENLDLFRRMRAGEFADGEKTLRAKIDLASPNMNMRDPTIYRIKHVEHHRQGDKWCIYPMYDFAHPIQDAIEGITFSLCSLDPDMLHDDDIRRMAAVKKLCPQFHLSLQSGCDKTLRAMRRPYTTAQYADIAAKLRAAFGADNVSFTTDVIVGFPGETEDDFEASMAFVTGMRFLKVHVFPYSRREGTAAYDFADQLPEHEKEARSRRMTAAVEEVRAAEAAAMQGRKASVLLETPLSATMFTGYTKQYLPVLVSAPGHKTGDIVEVTLGAWDGKRCRAEIV